MTFPNMILESIASHLWAVSWQVSILIALIWILSLAGRKSSSNFRYWLWFIVLIRLCIPFGLTLPVGIELNPSRLFETHVPSIIEEQNVLEKSFPVRSAQTFQAKPDESVQDIISYSKATAISSVTVGETLVLSWITGILLIGTLVLWRVLKLHNRLKKCPVITRMDLSELLKKLCIKMNIKQPVGLYYLKMDTINSPAVSGIVRPRIYLPKTIADTFSSEELEPILLHELSHIKKFDAVFNWIQIAVQFFYFFHPLVWLVNRKIRHLREEVSDDMALHYFGYERESYSESILKVVKNIRCEPTFSFVNLGLTERKSSLIKRIKRIMCNKDLHYSKMNLSRIMVLVFVGVFGISLASSEKSPKSHYDLDTAIKIAKIGDDLIQTAKGKLIYIENAPDTTSAYFKYMKEEAERYNAEHSGSSYEINPNQKLEVINYLYDRDTGKQRYDLENKTESASNVKLIKSYDGEKTTMISYHTRKGILTPEAAIYYEPFESPYYTPFYYGYYLYRKDISGMLATNTLDYGKQVIKDIEYVKSETVRNIPADIFSGMDKTGVSFTVWLSKEYLYRPVKIVLENEGVWGSETYIVYKKTGDKIYLPDKVEQNIYLFIDGKKEYAQGVIMDYVLDETTINVSIDPDEFFVEIPEGIEVHEMNSGN